MRGESQLWGESSSNEVNGCLKTAKAQPGCALPSFILPGLHSSCTSTLQPPHSSWSSSGAMWAGAPALAPYLALGCCALTLALLREVSLCRIWRGCWECCCGPELAAVQHLYEALLLLHWAHWVRARPWTGFVGKGIIWRDQISH